MVRKCFRIIAVILNLWFLVSKVVYTKSKHVVTDDHVLTERTIHAYQMQAAGFSLLSVFAGRHVVFAYPIVFVLPKMHVPMHTKRSC